MVPSPFEPQTVDTSGGALNVTFPVIVINSGFSPIENVLIHFKMVNDAGEPMAEVSRITTMIPAKSAIPLKVSFYTNFSQLVTEAVTKFMSGSVYFQYEAIVCFSYLHSRVGFAGTIKIPLEIGSPMYNFTITEFKTFDTNKINVTFSFTNKFQIYQLEFTSYILDPDGDMITDNVSYSGTVPLGDFNATLTYTITAPPSPSSGNYTVVFNFTKPFAFVWPVKYNVP
ncbi:MAG: hypothetical protein KIH01_06170 [Candidatus Freyarchaeota archaeon]|nr:hypothetical protein [Candidatus Jordarchaeia archaeon]